MNLNNKVVAVTGAGSGIGRGIALGLAAKGARLAILDIDESSMKETIDLIAELGVEARAYHCDIVDEEAVINTFGQIVSDFGVIHGLVNNAGAGRPAPLITVKNGEVIARKSAEDWDFEIDLNMKGTFLCAREGAAKMVELKVEEGCIINIASMGYRGIPGLTAYSAAKAGVVTMARVWSKELGSHNIRSVAIAPGPIKTEYLMSTVGDEGVKGLASQTPLNRLGDPGHIAQCVEMAFENDYLSGDVIEVGGGMTV